MEMNTELLLLLLAVPERGRGGGALRLISTGLVKTQVRDGQPQQPLPARTGHLEPSMVWLKVSAFSTSAAEPMSMYE